MLGGIPSFIFQIFILKNHRINCEFLILVTTSSMISSQKISSDRGINVDNETVLPVKQLPSTWSILLVCIYIYTKFYISLTSKYIKLI